MHGRPDGARKSEAAGTPEGAGTATTTKLQPSHAARGRSGRTPRRSPFEYAVLRVVPHVERGEAFNAGVVLHSRSRRFLGVRIRLDETVLAALAPGCDPVGICHHLDAIAAIARGEPDAGPIAHLTAPERFQWLVSPSSTVVQPSDVHTGLTSDPEATLDHLFERLVLDRS